jgi:DNA polymerase
VNLLTLDFETYYDDEYSLSKMSVEAYCRDPRFEILCCGYRERGDEYAHLLWGDHPDFIEELRDAVSGADAVVCHNAAFDGFILESVLGIEAPELRCTMTIPKFLGLSRVTSVSLVNLAAALGLGEKGDYLIHTKGRRLASFDGFEKERLFRYCVQDVALTEALHDRLAPRVPDWVHRFISMSIKMYTSPVLELDGEALERYRSQCLEKREADKEKLARLFDFESVEAFVSALRSRTKFCELLVSLGGEVPMKDSAVQAAKYKSAVAEASELVKLGPAKLSTPQRARAKSLSATLAAGGKVPALAKTDPGFMELLEHPDEDVALLARLRAENNSSIALSRAEALIEIHKRGYPMPVPLGAFGAQTGRYVAGTGHNDSASDRINLQNLPKRGPDATLRRAIRAPQGYVLVSGDSSQIEARVGAWIAGENGLTDIFARGDDPYSAMAGAIYGKDPGWILKGAKESKDPEAIRMREVGKVTMLSSQYGIGALKFSQYLLRAGLKLSPDPEVHYQESANINRLYNKIHSRIADYRRHLGRFLGQILDEGLTSRKLYYHAEDWLAVSVSPGKDGSKDFTIVLPNGFRMVYPRLRRSEDGGGFLYDQRRAGRWTPKKIYGALLFENLTQAMSFAILAEQGYQIGRVHRVVSNVHDSWVCAVPKPEAEEAKDFMLATMSVPPDWIADIPLNAEVKIGDTYEVA